MVATRTGLIIFDPMDIIEGTRLRRDLLLADAIAVDDGQLNLAKRYAELLCNLCEKDPAPILQRFDSDFDYLVKRGMVYDVPIWNAVIPDNVQSEVNAIEQVASQQLDKKSPYPIKLPDGSTGIIDPAGSFVFNKARADLLRARWIATELSTISKHYVTFASGTTQRLFDRSQGEARVLRIVISNLPVPASDTPWDKILEFKAESGTQAKLAQLRGWMVDMTVSTLTELQIQDKLEAALADYQAHMNIHKVEAEMGAIEVLLVTTAEILENVARLKFSKAMKTLFQVFKEDHLLMEAELKSAGRELAFIDSATARFT